MRWTMTAACNDCPFRREGGIRLTRARAREIGSLMLDRQGGTFICHKTVDYPDSDGDENGDYIPRANEIHCAGALIFAEKNKNATQMMRIAERCGLYDHRKFADGARAAVFDTLREMLAANSEGMRRS